METTNFSADYSSEERLPEGRIWTECIAQRAVLQQRNSQPDWEIIPVPLTHVCVLPCPVDRPSPLTLSRVTSATCCLYDKLSTALKFRECSCRIPGEATSRYPTLSPHRPRSNGRLKFTERCLCLDRILAPFPGGGINIQETGCSERLLRSKKSKPGKLRMQKMYSDSLLEAS